MWIICPHCQSSAEVPRIPHSGEILCDSRGSTFRVDSARRTRSRLGQRRRHGEALVDARRIADRPSDRARRAGAFRAVMMQRARAIGSRTVKEVALYRCLWAPRGVLDFPELLRLANLDESSLHPRIRGPLLYRLDRPEKAIQLLDEANASRSRRAWDWLFVAMTQQRLERLPEARLALAGAVRWIETADRGAKAPDGSRWYDWRERLEVQFLLEEARRMIEPGPATH